ncbi:hypothetical protein CWE13_03510 [Aliidiomarina shirensis]|uniref:Uncharacterized protein n=1 Tax=Aliidiomarina shirensis TaxID=1048642 RepID=A0A432WY89_9GAMM|nr:hypothetical protein [Aliidiomarina shirensis]RUO38716.1 hypothetical protein CWE13_03510 [Aliidiomarina shirensis]
MGNLVDAILFTVLVASAGLGLASLIVGCLPAAAELDNEAKARGRIEAFFFGVSGIVIALVMWLAMIFNS